MSTIDSAVLRLFIHIRMAIAMVALQLTRIHIGCLHSRLCLLQVHLHLRNPLLILLLPRIGLFAACGPPAPLSSSLLFRLLPSIYHHRHLSFFLVLWLSSKDSARVRMRILHLVLPRSSHEATPLESHEAASSRSALLAPLFSACLDRPCLRSAPRPLRL